MSQTTPIEKIRSGYAPINGVNLFYEERGEPTAPAVMLIAGLGAQMVVWPEIFCQGLCEQGFRVIRFDNRDVGLSSDTHYTGKLSVPNTFLRSKLKLPIKTPYDLEQMVDDAFALLDFLGVRQVHLIGMSLGGMIAQIATASHPKRVLSLISFMSSTNEPNIPLPDRQVLLHLLGITGTKIVDAESSAQRRLEFWRMIKSPNYLLDEEVVKQKARDYYNRAYRPQAGTLHNLAAIKTGGLVKYIVNIQAPTLVVHGDIDRLVSVKGGHESAKYIPNAQLNIIEGLGHELPEPACPMLLELMAEHIHKVVDSQAKYSQST